MDRKHLILTAAVILFATLLWWLSSLIRLPQTAVEPRTPETPDYTMEKLDATQIDKAGQPTYRLTASRLTHYPARHEAMLELPVLVQFRVKGLTVTTRADEARLPDDGRKIHMRGHVRMVERRNGRVVSDVSANQTDVLLQKSPTATEEHP